MMPSYPTVLCLVNWDSSDSMVDDGSYENWLEGTRILDAAIDMLPITVCRIQTEGEPYASDMPGWDELADALGDAGMGRLLIAGHAIERDVVPLALSMVRSNLEPILLFDVCGTLDPMQKWQALAVAVDSGVTVSTVRQTLHLLLSETVEPGLRTGISAILTAGFGEHAVELSAA